MAAENNQKTISGMLSSLEDATDRARWSQLYKCRRSAKEAGNDSMLLSPGGLTRYASAPVAKANKNDDATGEERGQKSGGSKSPVTVQWTPKGKITDAIFVPKSDPAPPGFEKITSSVGGRVPAEFGKFQSSAPNMCLCVEREGSKAPLTGMVVVLEMDDDIVPHGFELVPFLSSGHVHAPAAPALLVGRGATQRRAHVYVKRGFDSPPIVSAELVAVSKKEKPSADSMRLSTTPCGHEVEFLGHTKGAALQIAIRVDVSHLLHACTQRSGAASPTPRRSSSRLRTDSARSTDNEIAAPVVSRRGVAYSVDVIGPADRLRATAVRSLWNAVQYLNTPTFVFDRLRPFLVGCYTDDEQIVNISLKGILQFMSAMPEAFILPNLSGFSGDRALVEVVLVSVCDVLDRDNRFSGMCMSIFEHVIFSIRGVWGLISPVNRIVCSLLNLMSRQGGGGVAGAARGMSKRIFETLMRGMQREHVYNDRTAYDAEPDPAKAVLHLVLEKAHSLRSSITQTNFAMVLDRKFHVVSGEWSAQMWEIASSIFSHVGGEGSGEAGKDARLQREESKSLFIIIAILCKTASRTNDLSTPNVNGTHKFEKLSSLQTIETMLRSATSTFLESLTFGYLIRRFVVPVVIVNAQARDMDVFQLNLSIVSLLWKKCRAHLKIEFAILIEHVILRTLRSMFSPPEKKMMVIKEFESWFDMQPQALVEIFLNFDNDQTVGTVAHNALFNDFCALLCNIAEDGQSPGVDTDEKETIAVVHAAAESYGAVNKEYAETIRSLRMLALGTLSHIQRGLMDASATVHLITKEQNPDIRVNASAAGWDAYEDDNKIGAEQSSPWPKSSGAPATGEASTRRNHAPGGGSRSSEKGRREGSGGGRGSSGNRRSRRASVRVRFEINKEKEKILAAGLNLARKKSIKKCIKYLIETKYIAPNPREVVNWIRLNIDQLDETHVGDYLGEGGRTEAEMAFMKNVRDNYMRTMNFTAMGFVDALRTMLTRGGFRLPGEAQKIDRFIETFSRIYFESNRHLFKNADVIFVLSFSCVMLNTDAHNPGVKKKNKMTLDQYAKQLRDQGLSKGFITEVYEGIVNNEIEMPKALDTRADRKKSASVQEEEAKQLQLVQDPGTWADIYHRDLSRTIPLSLALLKGHTSKCMLYYSKMDTEVVSLMLEVGWVHFYGCVTTILESTADLDMVAILLDHVRYTISACLLLGLETERRAFAALLAKFSFMYSNHDWDSVGDAILFGLQSSSDTSSKNSAGKSTASDTQQQKIWFQNIMQADAHDSNVLDVIGEVHKLSACLRDSVIGRRQYEQVVEISHRFIGNTDRIVNDTNRRFIKEGQLVKKSNSGRFSYTFFLFSDMLLYAGTNIRGKLKVHQYLPLDSLVVIEESQDGPTCFDIKSSVKSFTIVTESVDAKNDWVEEIEQAKHEYESMGNSNGASSPAAALENGSMVSGSSPTLTIDLIDIVETTDAALNYVASSSEDDSDDDVQDINGSAASSGRSFFSGNATSPETPKMYNSAVGNSTAVRQGHFETINAAAAVAASSTFLHTPVPKRFKLMDEKKLDKVFRISLKVSRKVLEDQDRKYVATDAQKLLFYGLFKQATSGDCKVSAPDSKDWINRAKYDAWRVQMGSSTNMAKEQYIHLLETVAPSLIHEIWQ